MFPSVSRIGAQMWIHMDMEIKKRRRGRHSIREKAKERYFPSRLDSRRTFSDQNTLFSLEDIQIKDAFNRHVHIYIYIYREQKK